MVGETKTLSIFINNTNNTKHNHTRSSFISNQKPTKHAYTHTIKKSKGFDPLGDVLKPVGSSGPSVPSNGFTQATQPQIIPGAAQLQQSGKVLTGDLDSSLASLAENLTINKSATSSMK